MTTVGDRVLNISLPKIGEKSLFTKDLEEALKDGKVDFVVHSLKDLPTALPEDMTIGAVLEREDPRDALVLAKHHEGKCLKTLPAGSIIGSIQNERIRLKNYSPFFPLFLGTSSLRRIAQILRSHPHLKVYDIRGNLNTRLAKLDAVDSKYDGIVLAQAGLVRLGWQKRINQTIEPSDMLYAVGQGALAVECRTSDTNILEMLQKLVCHHTQCRILAERSFLKTLGGGCSAPVAVHSTLVKTDSPGTNDYKLNIVGSVLSLDGKTEIHADSTCILEMNEKINLVVERQTSDAEEDAVPPKKMKITNINLKSDELKSDQISPPKNIDITNQNLYSIEMDKTNVLSDVREKCLSSSMISTNKSTGMETQPSFYGGPSSKCPLNFNIGQEVMGQCPYSADSNQIIFEPSDSCDNSSNRNKILDMKNNISCPYKYGASFPNPDIAKCIIKSTTKLNSNTTNKNKNENLTSVNTVETLFCGIYPHRCWSAKVFEQCEQLGRNLANQLIEKNAISIMQCAQNEIRNKI